MLSRRSIIFITLGLFVASWLIGCSSGYIESADPNNMAKNKRTHGSGNGQAGSSNQGSGPQ